jgi:voltage-gated potassium channel
VPPIHLRSSRSHHDQALEQRSRARRELRMFVRRLVFLFVALVAIIVLGTVALSIAEGTSLGYSFSWTLDTVTTLGAMADPPDTVGRVIIVGLELFGIGTLLYGLATVAEFFVSGQLSGLLEERRNQRMIDSYTNHFIICGFGRVGRQVARDLRTAGVTYVAVDSAPSNREQAEILGVAYIEAYAADDEALHAAGIDRARAVIACVDSDADNIFIALTARELRPDILIVARASAEDSEKKLLRAGADRVISPYKTSGSEMARVALHPQVGGAFAVADFRMEEIDVPPSCEGVGQTIEQVRGDSVIVAVRHRDGRLEPQPVPDSVVEYGDMLVAIGTPAALEQLEAVFQPVAVQST